MAAKAVSRYPSRVLAITSDNQNDAFTQRTEALSRNVNAAWKGRQWREVSLH